MSEFASSGMKVYIEGTLMKRPRGRRKHPHLSRKFQERFFRLTLVSLKYYVREPTSESDLPKGDFNVSNIRIVEKVPNNVFDKEYVFQIGNQDEVMYMLAPSEEERLKWMVKFRQVASDNGNQMLEKYHLGLFARSHPAIHIMWSCCKLQEQRVCGCQDTTLTLPLQPASSGSSHHRDPFEEAVSSMDSDTTITGSTNLTSTLTPTPDVLQTEPLTIRHQPINSHSLTDTFRSRSSTTVTVDSGRETIPAGSPDITPWQSQDSLLSSPKNTEGHRTQRQWSSDSNLLDISESEEFDGGGENQSLQQSCQKREAGSSFPISPDPGSLDIGIDAAFAALDRKKYDEFARLIETIEDINSKQHISQTSLLQVACRRGLATFVELLLQHSADVNLADDGSSEKTPLHEASHMGYLDIVKMLLSAEADPLSRDSNDETPYDLAFKEKYYDVMDVLREAMPAGVRPYHLLQMHSSLTSDCVPALSFSDSTTLLAGSTESKTLVWEVPRLALQGTIRTAGTTSTLGVWGNLLAIGSNIVQLVDLSVERVRRIFVADEEPVQNPPMHLVTFGPEGYLATVNCKSKVVKVWPPPSPSQEFITDPIWSSGSTLDIVHGSITSLSASTSSEHPLLAVGEAVISGSGGRVFLLRWKGGEKQSYPILSAGVDETNAEMYTGFSHSGCHIATGCGRRLVIWEVLSGGQIYNLPIHCEEGAISSLCYSPDDKHLATGTSTGNVVVFEADSGGPIFTLEKPENFTSTAVSALAYSSYANYCAAGYKNGSVLLWKTFQRSLDGVEAMQTAESREEYRYKAVCIVEETPETSTCLEMPLFGHAKHNIESREVEYTISFLDYKLVIPPHATRGGKDIPFQTGEMPYGPVGPFKFPPNTKPVSSVVWFCSDQMSDLEKPIKIVLSHCLKSPNEDSLKNLSFVKACDKVSTQNRDKEFKFHIVTDEERDEEPLFTANDGTLVTRHACFFCIVEEVAREDIDHASYCLTEAFSYRTTGGVYEIRFILSYYLSPCLKTLGHQYGKSHKLTHHEVTFASQGPNSGIKFTFSRELPNGWTVVNKFSKSITLKKVHFLDKTKKQLALGMDKRVYPPNVVLEASGREATGDTTLEVKISGAEEEMESGILLKKPGPDTEESTAALQDAAGSPLPESTFHIEATTQTEQLTTPVQCTPEASSNVAEGRHPTAFPNRYPLSTQDYYCSTCARLSVDAAFEDNGIAMQAPFQEEQTHVNGYVQTFPVPHYELHQNGVN